MENGSTWIITLFVDKSLVDVEIGFRDKLPNRFRSVWVQGAI